jgi:hypothetical protein
MIPPIEQYNHPMYSNPFYTSDKRGPAKYLIYRAN